MFLKQVFYAHQGCIYLIKHTVKPFKRAVSVGLSWNVIYFRWGQSCIFSIITSVFSVTWSFRNQKFSNFNLQYIIKVLHLWKKIWFFLTNY